MTGHLALVPKIGKLVPLLGSDKSGEVVAAADAIGRTLRAAGHDWHDVAEAIDRGWSTPAAQPQPKQHLPWWQRTARSCILAGGYNLKESEADFLRSMMTWPTEPSQKQAVWLEAIAAALGLGRAA